MNSVFTLEEFDCKLGSDTAQRWHNWKTRLIFLCGLQKYDDQQKLDALFLFGGQKLFKICEGGKKKIKQFDDAVDLLSEYFKPQKNAAVEIAKFHRARQEPHETIENYVERLKNLSQNCDFGDLTNMLIKNHVINTCTSKEFRRVLLRDNKLELEDVVDLGRSYDVADEQAMFIEKQMEEEDSVAAISSRRNNKNTRFDNRKNNESSKRFIRHHLKRNESNPEKVCFYCGKEYPHENECPAKGKICISCGGKNHFARVCRSKKKEASKYLQNSSKEQNKIQTIEEHTVDPVKEDVLFFN